MMSNFSEQLFDATKSNQIDDVKRVLNEFLKENKIDSSVLDFQQEDGNNSDDDDDLDQKRELIFEFVNSVDKKYRTCLHYASALGYVEILGVLLKHGASLDICDEDGMNALHHSVQCHQFESVQALIDHSKFLGSFEEEEDSNSFGQYINSRCSKEPYLGYTSLHFVCSNHVSSSIEDKSKSSASQNRRIKKQKKMLSLLLKNGGDPTIASNDLENAMHICARSNRFDCTNILITESQCNLEKLMNQANKTKITPLMMCATLSNIETLFEMLNTAKDEIDLDIRDGLGDTALHFAFQSQLQRVFKGGVEVTKRHEECAYLLVRFGASIDIKSNDGFYPFDFCSDSLQCILTNISKTRSLWPLQLKNILDLPIYGLPLSQVDMKVKDEFVKAIEQYKEENKLYEERERTKKGCSMITKNPYLKKSINGMQVFNNETSTSTTGKCPMGYSSNDAPKCPLGYTSKDGEIPDFVRQPTTVPKEGKCPIPFHKEIAFLLKPQFWLYTLSISIVIILAKVI